MGGGGYRIPTNSCQMNMSATGMPLVRTLPQRTENDTAECRVWSGRCVNIAAQSHCHNACCAKHHCGKEFSSGSEHLNSQYFLLCVFE